MVCIQRSSLGRDLDIVVYMGGCCGDLVTALIDTTSVSLNTSTSSVVLSSDRQRLKKPFLFPDDQHKDIYLEEISMMYKSVSSHDHDYHVRRGNKFIGISVKNYTTALWAATRFKQIHRPDIWHSVKKSHCIDHVEQYAQMMLDYSYLLLDSTDSIIDLEDILQGQALTMLSQLTNHKLDTRAKNFYNNWLGIQNKNPHKTIHTAS